MEDQLILTFRTLPEPLQLEALHYLDYLKTKRPAEPNSESMPQKRSGYGRFKGKITYSDDFDAPLEEMKEYSF